MAKPVNLIRNVAGLIGNNTQKLNHAGNFFAVADGLDAYRMVTVELPYIAKMFIQGDTTVEEFYVPSDITSIKEKAFSGCPNLNDLTILNELTEITIDSTALSNTKVGNKETGSNLWVAESVYKDYLQDYGALYNIASYKSSYWYFIEYEVGVTQRVLNKQFINSLGLNETSYEGLVIPNYFTYITSISVEDLENVHEIWLKGVNNLIFDLDELPNGWVYDNGTLYVSPTDYDTFIANHSGYENYIVKGYELTISGNGTLTQALVDSITTEYCEDYEIPYTLVGKIIIPSTWTALGESNGVTRIHILDNLLDKTTSAKALVINRSYALNLSGDPQYPYNANLKSIDFVAINNVTTSRRPFYGRNAGKRVDVFLADFTNGLVTSGQHNFNIYYPKLKTITDYTGGYYVNQGFFFLGKEDIDNLINLCGGNYNSKIRCPATAMIHYLTLGNGLKLEIRGVLDGSNKYNSMYGEENCSMNYPKLTGIDTEANIQLLTPAENSLYLASDTGNLWQYSSGVWVNLFSGYTPTWYSDENCTTTIQPSDITSDMTVYVKLTAI